MRINTKRKQVRRTRRRTSTKRSHNKRTRSRTRSYGGCGCSNATQPSKGGAFFQAGGNINPPSFTNDVPIRYFYGQNDYMNDPNDPSAMSSARNLPAMVGGHSKKAKKMRTRKQKGGDLLMGSSYANNPFMTFGTVDGAANSTNIIYGIPTTNSSVYSQPSLQGFNSSNPPLA
jgi:hypothetical protein